MLEKQPYKKKLNNEFLFPAGIQNTQIGIYHYQKQCAKHATKNNFKNVGIFVNDIYFGTQ